jgi:ABC-type phosphate transport system auxiliary subunit
VNGSGRIPGAAQAQQRLFDEIRRIERRDIGNINFRLERVRLDQRRAELRGTLTPELEREFAERREALEVRNTPCFRSASTSSSPRRDATPS